MKIDISDNQMKITANPSFKGIAIVALIMICFLLYNVLYGFFAPEPDDMELVDDTFTTADLFGILFMCLWVGVVLFIGASALLLGCQVITVDANGVTSQSLCFQKTLTWKEIKDYGVSYYGQTRGEGNTYALYFATNVQPVKSDCKKKLKGNMIKAYVIGDAYDDVIQKVFSFCMRYTEVQPFVANDKFHWI